MKFDVNPVEGVHPELGLLLATLSDSTREWQENLETPTSAAFTWQPYENGPSVGGCILHLCSAEVYWLKGFVGGEELDPNHPAIAYDNELDQYSSYWPTPPSEAADWYFDILKSTREETIRLVSAHDDPSREYTRGKNTLTYRWILAHLVEHDSYTGGQAVLLHEMYKSLNK